MSDVCDLLIEIGTEELPPKALRRLMNAFAEGVVGGLDNAGLEHGAHKAFASPRRLAVSVEAVVARTPDQEIERKGPAVQAAYDADGNPTKAAEGFARSCGVDVSALERLETDKGAWLVYRGIQQGQAAEELLPAIVEQALAKLPIPKRMRWGAGNAEFVRPVHWILFLYGSKVIDVEILGTRSGNTTRGHRFHQPEAIAIDEAAHYEQRLADAKVLTDIDARKARVHEQVRAAARDNGGNAVIDEDLLEEVTALVEWPVAVVGRFDPAFLQVPAEALISSMQGHQRYFPMRDDEGRLLPQFITIANIESRDPEAVRSGNERVITPRLADAAFFWEVDRKRSLESRLDEQRSVVFQQQLGTLYEKSERVAALCDYLAHALQFDADTCMRAAWLAKCDLGTEMVGEFPELQGIMGRYYAVHDGEAEVVARALDEQYKPRFAGDETASESVGQVLAVAERADTLMGIFAIGRGPSGAKDPFALRRAALGLLRTLIERELDVDLHALLTQAASRQPSAVNAAAKVEEVFEFCLERLRAYYMDQGVLPEVFDAVAACRPARPLDFHKRVEAVRRFWSMSEAESLAAANKRIRNILRKSETAPGDAVETALLEDTEEKALHIAVAEARASVAPMVEQGLYGEALTRLAALREPVDRFFDQVLVMAEDPEVRRNRLTLLRQIGDLFFDIADISRLPSA